MYRKTYILPNGYENLEMEVAVDIVPSNSGNNEDSVFCGLYFISVIDKDDSDNNFTKYSSKYFRASQLYRTIMMPDKYFLWEQCDLLGTLVPSVAYEWGRSEDDVPKNMYGLFERHRNTTVPTKAFTDCLGRISKDINAHYEKVFFEYNSHLKKSPDDMAYIFEACKYFSNFE